MIFNKLALKLPKKESLDTLYYTIGNIFSTFLTFVTLPILTKLISPEQFGIFNYTNPLKSFLFTLTFLSLNTFLLRYYFKLKTDLEKKILFGTIFTFLLYFSTALLIAELLIFPFFIDFFELKIYIIPRIPVTKPAMQRAKTYSVNKLWKRAYF